MSIANAYTAEGWAYRPCGVARLSRSDVEGTASGTQSASRTQYRLPRAVRVGAARRVSPRAHGTSAPPVGPGVTGQEMHQT